MLKTPIIQEQDFGHTGYDYESWKLETRPACHLQKGAVVDAALGLRTIYKKKQW
ncbi:MAG: hypothetical protein R6U62_05515 [Bacteroidales bacterium]